MFFTLPLELRLAIYRLLLLSQSSLQPFYHEINRKSWRRRAPSPLFTEIHLSILRVCREVHNEANHIFYSENYFSIPIEYAGRMVLPTGSPLKSWCMKTRPKNVGYIRNVQLDWRPETFRGHKPWGPLDLAVVNKQLIVFFKGLRSVQVLRLEGYMQDLSDDTYDMLFYWMKIGWHQYKERLWEMCEGIETLEELRFLNPPGGLWLCEERLLEEALQERLKQKVIV